jgi:hypothetical protein
LSDSFLDSLVREEGNIGSFNSEARPASPSQHPSQAAKTAVKNIAQHSAASTHTVSTPKTPPKAQLVASRIALEKTLMVLENHDQGLNKVESQPAIYQFQYINNAAEDAAKKPKLSSSESSSSLTGILSIGKPIKAPPTLPTL